MDINIKQMGKSVCSAHKGESETSVN